MISRSGYRDTYRYLTIRYITQRASTCWLLVSQSVTHQAHTQWTGLRSKARPYQPHVTSSARHKRHCWIRAAHHRADPYPLQGWQLWGFRPLSGKNVHLVSKKGMIELADFKFYKSMRWLEIRVAQLKLEPSCKICGKPASVCDHIRRHGYDPAKFWAGPFQSLCTTCHSSGKQYLEKRGFSRDVGEDGWPVDKKHPANRERP